MDSASSVLGSYVNDRCRELDQQILAHVVTASAMKDAILNNAHRDERPIEPFAAGLMLRHQELLDRERMIGSQGYPTPTKRCEKHNVEYVKAECSLCYLEHAAGMDVKTDPVEAHVTRPSHYTRFKIEPITFCMENGFEFWRGNIIKYVARAGFKPYPNMDEKQSEVADLRKAKRMIEMRLNQLDGKGVL